jgi:hypothetical protein
MVCDRDAVTDKELFDMRRVNDTTVLMKNKASGKYCRDLGDNILCDSDKEFS